MATGKAHRWCIFQLLLIGLSSLLLGCQPAGLQPNTEEQLSEADEGVEEQSEVVVNDSNQITPKDLVRQYTFNHSLWFHVSSQHENTNTAYWIAEFAAASGAEYRWNGQFGQLDYHGLPPRPQLGTVNSTEVFPTGAGDVEIDSQLIEIFREQVFLDSILIMPPNFVQWDTETIAEQAGFAQRVIDWVLDEGKKTDAIVYIYEHWPEAEADVLSAEQWQTYHNETLGSYHQWHESYLAALIQEYPEVDLRMIPVGPIIAEIIQNTDLPLNGMTFDEFYEDNAPHGRPNIYFLAGLVTYQALFGQKVSVNYVPSVNELSGVNAELSDAFTALNDFVWHRLQAYQSEGIPVWSATESM